MKFLTPFLFICAYAGIVLKRAKSLYFVFSSIFLLLVLRIIDFGEIFRFINYNVLGIFLGTSILSYLFAYSGVPSHIVDKIIEREYPSGIIFLLLCIITGLIFAFVENVATILIMAPVAIEFTKKYKINSCIPTILLILTIISLAISSFFQDKFSYFPAFICLFYGFSGILWLFIKRAERINIKEIGWESFFLLIGIFILVGSLKKVGFIEDIANFLLKGGENQFKIFLMIVWISVLISAFIDNIPYTMVMISGIKVLCEKLNTNPYVFLFGLLIGICVGGNITPIGASCNVVATGILKKNGYRVSFFDFFKIGFPFSIISVAGSTFMVNL